MKLVNLDGSDGLEWQHADQHWTDSFHGNSNPICSGESNMSSIMCVFSLCGQLHVFELHLFTKSGTRNGNFVSVSPCCFVWAPIFTSCCLGLDSCQLFSRALEGCALWMMVIQIWNHFWSQDFHPFLYSAWYLPQWAWSWQFYPRSTLGIIAWKATLKRVNWKIALMNGARPTAFV